MLPVTQGIQDLFPAEYKYSTSLTARGTQRAWYNRSSTGENVKQKRTGPCNVTLGAREYAIFTG